MITESGFVNEVASRFWRLTPVIAMMNASWHRRIAEMIPLTEKTPHFLGRETRDSSSVMGKKSSLMREGRKATE
jgi:hypothetical protein